MTHDPAGGRRLDIQILRALAVLLVLGFHGFEAWLPWGYLGVDVFFAISGFLMVGIVARGLADGSFSLRGFWVRRARRILPAALVTLLAATLASAILLTTAQWRDFLWQLAGALTFTANFFLWEQGGYFDPEIETRPLLHFWSLAVEEQFYLLFPLVFAAFPRRFRAPAVAAGAAASLLLYLVVNQAGHHAASFFLLPTRLWQLLAGGLCALLVLRRGALPVPGLLSFAALAVIAATAAGRLLPGPAHAPLLVVLATCLILLGRDSWLPRILPVRAAAAVGDWSYSLYLIHWPLLAFANALYAGTPPLWVTAALLAASFPLAWLQYRLVEEPFRRSAPLGRRAPLAVAGAAAMLVAAAFSVPTVSAGPVPEPVKGLDKICALGWQDPDRPRCRTSDSPEVAVWGDSFAMHLVPGLAAHPRLGRGLVQYTMPSCTPILAVARPGEQLCMAFNRQVFEQIAAAPHIRAVVLGATWQLIAKERARPHLQADGEVRPLAHREVVGALRETIRALERAGKSVFVVGPTPMAIRRALDPPLCNLRQLEGRILLGRSHCMIPLSSYRAAMPDVNRSLAAAAEGTGARLYLPETALCRHGMCATRTDRTLLYRDGNHLSEEGSRIVLGRLGLPDAVARVLAPEQR